MLSTDRRLFEEGGTRRRIASYGSFASTLDVIVVQTGNPVTQAIAENVSVTLSGGRSKLEAVYLALRLLIKCAKKKPDVITTQDPMLLGLMGLVAAKLYRVPLQVQIHTDCFSYAYASESIRRLVESCIARVVIHGASGVRVVSERVARSVKNVTKSPVFVIPIMNDTEYVAGNPRPSDLLGGYSLVSVSRLTREKNCDLLVEALKNVPEATLTLVGDGPERFRLESLAEKLGVTNRLRITGWKEDVRPYLEHADACVFVSRYEGYGLSLIEAAHYARPIITTDVGIVGDILIKDRDVIVVRPRSDEIASAVKVLMSDSSKAEALGGSARRAAQARLIGYDTYLTKYREALHAVSSERVG